MAADSEKLLVSIAADTSNLVKGLATADSSLARFGRNAEAVSTRIFSTLGAFAGGAAATGLASFARQSLESAAALGRLADQAGLSVQQFQGLNFALREAGVSENEFAQAFAQFARNLSDLQRGTGPFLQFLREAAPQFIANFNAARDTGDAFGILTDIVARLGDAQDRLRILNAAGGEQFGRFANAMREGRASVEETARSFQGLTEAETKAAQEIERRWSELSARFLLFGKQIAVGITDGFRSLDTGSAEAVEREIRRLEGIRDSQLTLGRNIDRVTAQIERQRRALEELRMAADNIGGAPAATPEVLGSNAIRAAQGELALLQQRLQALPMQAEFASSAFAAAWEKQIAVMRLQGETEAAISAARIAMLRQEDAERLRVLGSAIQPYDELIRRQLDLNHALETGLIDSEQFARAMTIAAATMRDSYLSATAAVGQSVARVFEGNKTVAVAAAIIDTLAAANKALAAPPGPPVSFAYVAAALATGFANVRAILSTTKTSTAIPGGGGAAAPTAPTVAQQQSLSIQGVDPAMFYSGGQLESLIGRLNDVTKQGFTLLATVPRV